MAKYEVLSKKAYLVPVGPGSDGGPRLIERGEKVELDDDVLPGSNLKPLDNAARAARKRKEELDAARKAQREKEAAAKIAAALVGTQVA